MEQRLQHDGPNTQVEGARPRFRLSLVLLRLQSFYRAVTSCVPTTLQFYHADLVRHTAIWSGRKARDTLVHGLDLEDSADIQCDSQAIIRFRIFQQNLHAFTQRFYELLPSEPMLE